MDLPQAFVRLFIESFHFLGSDPVRVMRLAVSFGHVQAALLGSSVKTSSHDCSIRSQSAFCALLSYCASPSVASPFTTEQLISLSCESMLLLIQDEHCNMPMRSVQRWGGAHSQRMVVQEEVEEECRQNSSSTDKKKQKQKQ